jgi:hypothetical protein
MMFMNIRRSGLIVAVLTCASPAGAQEMRAVEVRDFIVGDHFAYTCVDGSTGSGRIYADGSVTGYIRPGGTGPHRYVVLPPGTLQIKGERYCASLRGIAFKPCFNVERINEISFRGSVSGLDFAYCNFTRLGARSQEFANYRLRGVRTPVGLD